MTVPIQVAVCGPRDCTDDDWVNAHEVGVLLARRGAVVICGGHRGVTAAVAAGAKSARGTAVGILAGTDRDGAGPDLSAVVPTGLGDARDTVIAGAGDALIAVGGSWDTLATIARTVHHGRIPVVQLGEWHFTEEFHRQLPGVLYAKTPAEAISLTGLWPSALP
ncbi:SLOG cluster 4 domain-containing protein [Actinomadura fibrosa]|uniref:Dethiobiotin synthetase n=1 Tax=Actinomadura fibrosa TaxID=111802 RepID=A0ABW2Y5A3_9ACTN|nr:dethiobiotin synthetase [Actinomadura fibrosa]